MTHSDKRIFVALTVSTILIVFNIIAVTQGKAEPFYLQLENTVKSLFT